MIAHAFAQLINNQAIEFDSATGILLFDEDTPATNMDFEFLDSGRGWLFTVNSLSGPQGRELSKTVSLLRGDDDTWPSMAHARLRTSTVS